MRASVGGWGRGVHRSGRHAKDWWRARLSHVVSVHAADGKNCCFHQWGVWTGSDHRHGSRAISYFCTTPISQPQGREGRGRDNKINRTPNVKNTGLPESHLSKGVDCRVPLLCARDTRALQECIVKSVLLYFVMPYCTCSFPSSKNTRVAFAADRTRPRKHVRRFKYDR